MTQLALAGRPRFDITAVELVGIYTALKDRTYGEFKWDALEREKTVVMCAEIMKLQGVDIDWEALAERLDDDLAEERRIDRGEDADCYDGPLPFDEPACLRDAGSGDGALDR